MSPPPPGDTPKSKLRRSLGRFLRDLALGVGLHGGAWLLTLGAFELTDNGSRIDTAVVTVVGVMAGLGGFYLTCAGYRALGGDPMKGTSLPLWHRLLLVAATIASIVPFLWFLGTRVSWW